jgi:isocitrate lyase
MKREYIQQVADLRKRWDNDARWKGIHRDYSPEDVLKLRPSIKIEYSLAKHGAERLWHILNTEPYVTSLGALTGSQAVQMVKAGMKAIYMSGWQVAADANLSGQTYPDQSLYPSNSVPCVVKRLNNALMRADQIHAVEGGREIDWYVPIIADAEAGFGGALHAFELMKSMIEAGAAGVHYEDQLASEKKCGHLGGKVLVPTSQFIRTLVSARLAADVSDVPTVIVARTDALSATLLTSDIDPRDKEYIYGERTAEGYYRVHDGLEPVIARALAYAPYADVLWFETSKPDLKEAEKFAEAVQSKFPGKLMAYNCSPSFNWRKNLDDTAIASFNSDLGNMGFKYQFITLAGWHAINHGAYKLAHEFAGEGMPAYVRLQEEEFASESTGYTAARHQREVGTGYFDQILMTVTGGAASTAALKNSTESQQFKNAAGNEWALSDRVGEEDLESFADEDDERSNGSYDTSAA